MGTEVSTQVMAKKPAETDRRLATWLQQACGLSKGCVGLTVTGGKPNLEKAHQMVLSSLAPAKPELLVAALSKLSTLVMRRSNSDESAEVTHMAYAESLTEYPADVALEALALWPKRSQWWPTWFELQEVLESLVRDRRETLRDIERMREWNVYARLAPPPAAERVPTYDDMSDAEKQEVGVGLRSMATKLSNALKTVDSNPETSSVTLKERVALRGREKSR